MSHVPSTSSQRAPHHHHRRRSSRPSSSSDALVPPADSRVYVEVFFLDNSFKTFHVPALIKENELTLLICQKLGFASPESEGYFFGLVESTQGLTLDRPLAKTEEVGILSWQWQQEEAPNKLIFVCKLFFDSVLRSPDPIVQYYRFTQGVHHVVTGLYPVPAPLAVRLACLQFRAKFGETCKVFRTDFLGNRVVEFVPQALFRTRKPSAWSLAMEALFKEDGELRKMGEEEAQRAYLALIERHPLYGSTLFNVVREPQTPNATAALLAVNGKGIQLYPLPPTFLPLRPTALTGSACDEADVVHAVAGPDLVYALADMLRWGYVPSTLFYVAVKVEDVTGKADAGSLSEQDPSRPQAPPQQQQSCVNFGSPHGSWICDCITLYAYGFLTEQERQQAKGGGGVDEERVLPLEEEEES